LVAGIVEFHAGEFPGVIAQKVLLPGPGRVQWPYPFEVQIPAGSYKNWSHAIILYISIVFVKGAEAKAFAFIHM
jgi:hypothetical protein